MVNIAGKFLRKFEDVLLPKHAEVITPQQVKIPLEQLDEMIDASRWTLSQHASSYGLDVSQYNGHEVDPRSVASAEGHFFYKKREQFADPENPTNDKVSLFIEEMIKLRNPEQAAYRHIAEEKKLVAAEPSLAPQLDDELKAQRFWEERTELLKGVYENMNLMHKRFHDPSCASHQL
jgi:hypothetical protein